MILFGERAFLRFPTIFQKKQSASEVSAKLIIGNKMFSYAVLKFLDTTEVDQSLAWDRESH